MLRLAKLTLSGLDIDRRNGLTADAMLTRARAIAYFELEFESTIVTSMAEGSITSRVTATVPLPLTDEWYWKGEGASTYADCSVQLAGGVATITKNDSTFKVLYAKMELNITKDPPRIVLVFEPGTHNASFRFAPKPGYDPFKGGTTNLPYTMGWSVAFDRIHVADRFDRGYVVRQWTGSGVGQDHWTRTIVCAVPDEEPADARMGFPGAKMTQTERTVLTLKFRPQR
jgi:hypothetical protein